MIIDLAKLEPNKVSTDLKDYSMLITAPSGFGKTPFLYELFGDRALFLSFENSSKGIAGIHSVDIDGYDTLNAYIMQLQNPEIRKKYDVIVIDTLFLFDHYIEKSINDAYGKDTLSDCLAYNKAYKIVDKKFLECIKKIQRMNYTMAYVCHPVEKKCKVAGTEIVRIEPKVSDRIKDLLIPEVDVRLFCHYDTEGKKVIYTEGTQFFDARVRVGDMIPVLPFDAETLKKEFEAGINKRIENKEMLVDKLEKKNVVSETNRNFEEVMAEIVALGESLATAGLLDKANKVIFKELGCDSNGKQRTLNDVNEDMIPALEVIIQNLKALK